MGYKRLFLSMFLFIGINSYANAQIVNYLGLEQGLSNNNVNTIHQDRFGFMWFGTQDGLNRYDGYSFKSFRNKIGDITSLPGDEVYTIAEDNLKNMWVGTSKGIGILNNKTFKFSGIRYIKSEDPYKKALPLNQRVYNISIDKKGTAFICTNDAGLLICENNSKIAKQIPLQKAEKTLSSNYSVNSMAFDAHGNAWLLVDNVGLCIYNNKYKAVVIATAQSLKSNAITVDFKGNIWIGTNKGLYFYEVKSSKLALYSFTDKNFQNSRICDISFDTNQKLWIGTDGDGLAVADVFGKGGFKVFKQSTSGALNSDMIHSVFIDKDSRKWIGTIRGGINIIDNKKMQFKSVVHEPNLTNSLADNCVYSLCEDIDKNIWIGTDGRGISVWNRKLNSYKNYVNSNSPYSLGSNRISGILKDDQQNIWVATYGDGVNKFNKATGQFLNIPGTKYVVKIFMDSEKNIWACCIKGRLINQPENALFKYDKVANVFKPVQILGEHELFSIADDNNGNLWLGGLTNLIKFNKESGKITKFNIGAITRALHYSKNGVIWIGTYGKGLMNYNLSKNRFKSYTEDNGLCNNTILNIEEDNKQNIWVSTYNGLSRFNPALAKFDNFYAGDGLQSNQFYYNASAHLSSGELLFGGIKGFSIFNPDSIKHYNDFPAIAVTDIRVAGKSINAESEFVRNSDNIYQIKSIELPYEQGILSLDYVALEYSQPEKVKYAYYLKGWDKSWNYVNNIRSANYSRLNEGHYTLLVKSTNSSGIWNQTEKIISITVFPPWYRTWYAYLLYFLSISGCIYFYIVYQKRQERLNYEVKLTNLKALQEKELNEKKISFFTNISHELRTPLTLIANPIKELINSDHKNIDLIDLNSVYRNTRRLLSMIDQLMLFQTVEAEVSGVKKEWLNLSELCREVFLCFNNQVKAKCIQYNFNCQNEQLEIYADREKIEIVLYNLLSNAVKFTPANGIITMQLSKKEEKAEIIIKDNGVGISENAQTKLFEKFHRGDERTTQSGFGIGLFLAKKFMEMHQGQISCTSKTNEGTIFHLLLPINDKKFTKSTLTSGNLNRVSELIYEIMPITQEELKVNEDTGRERIDKLLGKIVTEKPTILLIDDDSDLRHYIKSLLKDDYIVYETDNATEGLEMVLESEPDIIVCDIVMQGMSGVEFCSKMKESPTLSHIPIILLTSSSSPEVKLKGIECGADDYITKPFENDLLLARIKGILKGRNMLKQYFFNEITLKNNSVKIPQEYSVFLYKCIETIENHLDDEKFSVKVFALKMGMSQSNLFKKVKSISGLSINEFIRFIRLRKAAELMINTDLQIKEVAYKVGFQQLAYFRQQFYRLFEVNPSEFITRHRKTFQGNHKINDSIHQLNRQDS